ncbi:uncharacterized protein LOC126841362 [Adelges cooleyi]|uniref:uncharacterized protein LOC126841362 n=1 Tax=Adelges cooleyi TaxID=133065 RepID=UPI00217FADB8|nr:uncharacterized protein LOC126841362 [Adelges cooleyi]
MYFKLTFFLLASVLIANVVGPETGKRSDIDINDNPFSYEKLENELMRRIFESLLIKNGIANYDDSSTINLEIFRDFLNDSEMSEYVLNNCRASGSRNNVTGQITLEEFMHLIRSATERSKFNTVNEFTQSLKIRASAAKEVGPETRDRIKTRIKGDKDFISLLNDALDAKPVNGPFKTEDLENELMCTIFETLIRTTGLNYEAHSTINLDMFRGYVNNTDMSNTLLNEFHLTGGFLALNKDRITLEQFKRIIRSGSKHYKETVNNFTKKFNRNI